MLKHLWILTALGTLTLVGLMAGQSIPAGPLKQGVAKLGGGQQTKQQINPIGGNQTTPRATPSGTQPSFAQTNSPQASSAQTCDEVCQQGRENLAIQGKLKTFTGFLVVVGALQAFALIGTVFVAIRQEGILRNARDEIRNQAESLEAQAGHMEAQTKILASSVAVAQKSADAATAQIEFMKSKERAQLRIELDPLSLVYDQKADGYPIRFKVFLDGLTRATIVHESIIAYLADSPITRVSWEPLGLGGTFSPDLSPIAGVTFIQTDDDVSIFNETDGERIKLVHGRKLDVYVTGKIRYRDLFGDEWEIGIDRTWHQWSSYGEGEIRGAWGASGNGKGDYHCKVEQPQKPN